MTAPAKAVDTRKLIAEIAAGRHDEALQPLLAAIRARVEAEATLQHRWQITYDDDTWTEDDVTLDQVELVENITETSWLAHDPVRRVQHLKAYLFAHLVKVKAFSTEAAARKVDAMTLAEAARCVTQVIATDRPKDDPPTSDEP